MRKIISVSMANWIDIKGGQKEDSHAEFKGSFSLTTNCK
jgi:hypothetical protein